MTRGICHQKSKMVQSFSRPPTGVQLSSAVVSLELPLSVQEDYCNIHYSNNLSLHLCCLQPIMGALSNIFYLLTVLNFMNTRVTEIVIQGCDGWNYSEDCVNINSKSQIKQIIGEIIKHEVLISCRFLCRVNHNNNNRSRWRDCFQKVIYQSCQQHKQKSR